MKIHEHQNSKTIMFDLMEKLYQEHPTEEVLERFILNTSSEDELESVETHILACEHCVNQLETIETDIAATRLALQNVETNTIGAG